MLVTLVAVLCNSQICLEKIVTNSDQSSISMMDCAVHAQAGIAEWLQKTGRTGPGGCKATNVSWANTRRRVRPDERTHSAQQLAGDAVLIALVSSRIPCKQGIFQGILEISTEKVPLVCKKPLCHSDFLQNSL